MPKLERHDPDWNDTAPTQVVVERRIDATAEAIWAELADHESWPEWFDNLSDVEVTGAASGVGAQRRVTVKGAGPFDEIFNTWDENAAFGFTVVETRVPVFAALNELVTLTPADDGVLVRYQQAIELKRWVSPLARFVTPRLRSSLEDALEALAGRVESGD